ncbi:unnamed protein product [Staurois parvus]|uniref:Mos1 transposase HTH domain-containing protein n=1 Tax=Staurois parvus TaxID=386267 RepID=A0ABN9EQK7_9NEOB|nr:unnamed protein product [Staurois parvus]
MSDSNVEQQINIKLCVKIGKCTSKMLALLQQAYGKHSMKKSRVFELHKQFKEGQEDDTRSRQPPMQSADANLDTVCTLVCSDQTLGVRIMAEELNMNMETVRQILTEDLGFRKMYAKMVP